MEKKSMFLSVRIPSRHIDAVQALKDDSEFNLNRFLVSCLVAKSMSLYGEKFEDKSKIDDVLNLEGK
jgi:hypothetical protein